MYLTFTQKKNNRYQNSSKKVTKGVKKIDKSQKKKYARKEEIGSVFKKNISQEVSKLYKWLIYQIK